MGLPVQFSLRIARERNGGVVHLVQPGFQRWRFMHKQVWVVALALVVVPFASAGVFTIDSDNLGGALCSVAAPCGTVTVTGTSTLQVSINLNPDFGIFGNNSAFGFNVVGSTADVAMSNFSSSLFSGTGGSGNVDGWGSFMFRVDGPPGSQAISSLSFDVTRSSDPFTGPSDIEAGATGANGFTTFAMHIRNNSSELTGFAGVDPVPEPSSLFLLSGGLLVGLGGLIRKRKRIV